MSGLRYFCLYCYHIDMHKSWLAALLIAAVAGGGCRSGWKKVPASAAETNAAAATLAPKSRISSEDRVEALARFATGISLEANQQPHLALDEYRKAAKSDPGNEALVVEVARRYLQLGQRQIAVELLERSAKRPDSSGAVHVWLGRAYMGAGKTNQAIAAMETGVSRSPKQASGYQVLTEAYIESNRKEAALALLDKAAQLEGADPYFQASIAELYGSYIKAKGEKQLEAKEKAVALLERAVEAKPKNPMPVQKIGDAFLALGEMEKAAKVYLQMLEDFPDLLALRDVIREKLANIYLQSKDKKAAEEQLLAIIRESPRKYPQAYFILGNLAMDQKQFVKAAEYFRRATVMNPEFEQAYYELAAAQMSMEEVDEALRTLDVTRRKFSPSFFSEYLTARAYARKKDYKAAIRHLTTAEVIASATDARRLNHFFYYEMGATYERNKDYEQAARYFERALQLAPNSAEVMNYLGYMWAEQGTNLAKARKLIEKAVELEPKNAAYIDSLAWVLYKLNEPRQALSYIEKAISLNEQPDATLYDHMGDIYQALNDTAKAREAWQKSLSIEPNPEVEKKLKPGAL